VPLRFIRGKDKCPDRGYISACAERGIRHSLSLARARACSLTLTHSFTQEVRVRAGRLVQSGQQECVATLEQPERGEHDMPSASSFILHNIFTRELTCTAWVAYTSVQS
jgi:hypothetical protein